VTLSHAGITDHSLGGLVHGLRADAGVACSQLWVLDLRNNLIGEAGQSGTLQLQAEGEGAWREEGLPAQTLGWAGSGQQGSAASLVWRTPYTWFGDGRRKGERLGEGACTRSFIHDDIQLVLGWYPVSSWAGLPAPIPLEACRRCCPQAYCTPERAGSCSFRGAGARALRACLALRQAPKQVGFSLCKVISRGVGWAPGAALP